MPGGYRPDVADYTADLDSLGSHPLPDWYRDAKLGIFVHWTAATVPAFAPLEDDPFTLGRERGWEYAMSHSPYVEWYQNSLAIEGSPVARHHAEHWPGIGYEEFVARFVAATERWDPDSWSELFRRAGASYVVFVTKHHDGVTLWPSRTPNPVHDGWHTRRDCVSELAEAVRQHDLRFGVYYSGGLDWTFGGLPMRSFDDLIRAIPTSAPYCEYADGHWRELIDLVGPDVLWNDIAYPPGAGAMQLFADFYNGHPDGVVNDRFDVLGVQAGTAHADFVTPEYSSSPELPTRMFEVCRGIGRSFGYNAWETETDYLDPDELVWLFVDIVAHGGNLLLNVGPTATGDIPAAQARRLLALGWWLEVNGEAVYGTRPWTRTEGTTGDGLPVRFTSGGDVVYAIVGGTPAERSLELDVRPAPGASLRLLGDVTDADWAPTDRGCRVELPVPLPAAPAHVVRIERVDR